MPITQLTFALKEGYIHHWLAAGPQETPIENGVDTAQIVRHYHQPQAGFSKALVCATPLASDSFTAGGDEGVWTYVRCQEDHFVDHSARYGSPVYLRSWAYTGLISEVDQEGLFILTTNGPADVWINAEHVHAHEPLPAPNPQSTVFTAALAAGLNQILVQFETLGRGGSPDFLALQLCQAHTPSSDEGGGPIQGVHIEIPTTIEAVDRRKELETSFETIFLNKDVFTRDDQIQVHWPDDLDRSVPTDVRLESAEGLIYAHAEMNGDPGEKRFLSFGSQLYTGRYRAFFMPRAWEFYEHNLHVSKEIPFWVVGDNQFSPSPYGKFPDRRIEALKHAVLMKNNLYADIARMALGLWKDVDLPTIQAAIARVNRRESGSSEDLIGLLRMYFNFGRKPNFPKPLKDELKACLLDFRYWLDEPGAGSALDFCDESRQIMFHTCEILAGQRFPAQVFSNNGQTGRQHRQHGEMLALAWLRARATQGFSQWNSALTFARALTALSLLADFADSEAVSELAIILMDKIFYALALNSYHGVLGASAGQTSLAAIQGGYLQETSGVTRVMWGLGLFNQHLAAPVSLAIAKEYELPLLFVDIAHADPDALWSREQHAVISPDGPRTVHLSTLRTPDWMLSSAQDYYPGQPGCSEHIWQATLGPGATVFVNHPANASHNEALPASYWLGNRVLPRVGQWNDCLVALYHLPKEDWMGFTHAYFPTFAFDEWVIRDHWAFARKGSGFLALTASTGIELVRQGREALRELRAAGPDTIWICQMGRALHDISFADFQAQVLAQPVTFEDLSVRIHTIRGEEISFGWEGPFTRDGQEITLKSARHYDSLFGVADFPPEQMDIQFEDRLLRLDLSGLSDSSSEP